MSSEEDPVLARIIESGFVLEPASPFLTMEHPVAGARSEAEAFIANAPSLYGYERDYERQSMVMDVAVSAVQADPTYGGGYALVAASLYRVGVQDVDIYDRRALDAALPWALRAVKMEPECEAGWEVLVEILCLKGDFTNAESALGKIYNRFGDNDLYARTAFLFFRLQGNVAQAINWGALAWQTEWDNNRLTATLFALGHLYFDVGETQKALDAFRVITDHDHQNAWAYHYWAKCVSLLGEFAKAKELNEIAIRFGGIHEFREFQEFLNHQIRGTQPHSGLVRQTGVPTSAPTGKRSRTSVRRRGTTGVRKKGSRKFVAAPPPGDQKKRLPKFRQRLQKAAEEAQKAQARRPAKAGRRRSRA